MALTKGAIQPVMRGAAVAEALAINADAANYPRFRQLGVEADY